MIRGFADKNTERLFRRGIVRRFQSFERHFGTTPEFWVNLQAHYDLETTQDRDGKRIEREVSVAS